MAIAKNAAAAEFAQAVERVTCPSVLPASEFARCLTRTMDHGSSNSEMGIWQRRFQNVCSRIPNFLG